MSIEGLSKARLYRMHEIMAGNVERGGPLNGIMQGKGDRTMESTQREREGERKMDQHQIVGRDEWITARKAYLAKEKEFTKAYDELRGQLRELPWVRVE